MPPMMVATRPPKAAASILPITTSPRTRNRTRHSRRDVNNSGQQPGQQHVGRGELGVQAAGHQQNRHPDDRREQTEIGVSPSVVDEPLDAQGSGGQRQMAVEHGPSLKVVEVVLVDRGTEEVDRAPQRPEDPEEGNGHQRYGRRGGYDETAAARRQGGSHRPTVGGHRRIGTFGGQRMRLTASEFGDSYGTAALLPHGQRL